MSAERDNRMDDSATSGLVLRAQAGDADAWATLYQQLRRRVFGLCRYLLGSVEAAEDATNEVFLKAQRAMSSYDSTIPFPRWLLSVAGHHCIDQLRRRRVEQRLFAREQLEAPDLPAPGPSALGTLLSAERAGQVRRAVEALPEHYRLPLVLRFYNDLSYDEIAVELGLKRNNVATLLFRAKKELRRALERKQGAF